jgi:hypothetical protein
MLVEDEDEQAVIAFIMARRAEGRTIRGIVAECQRRGFASRSGEPLQKTQVERILKRAA